MTGDRLKDCVAMVTGGRAGIDLRLHLEELTGISKASAEPTYAQ